MRVKISGTGHISEMTRITRPGLFSGKESCFQVIRQYAIAFLEKHVAGKMGSKGILERQDSLLTRYVRH